jgi:hypothetical protein
VRALGGGSVRLGIALKQPLTIRFLFNNHVNHLLSSLELNEQHMTTFSIGEMQLALYYNCNTLSHMVNCTKSTST